MTMRFTPRSTSTSLSRSFRIAIPGALAVTLSACGGGGSGGGEPGASDPSATPEPRGPGAVVLTGSVGDGPIVGATVTVRDASGEIVDEVKSDARAKYRAELPGSVEYPLQISAEGGQDLVSDGEPDFTLRAVLLNAEQEHAHLSPFSTLIAAVAAEMEGGVSAANLSAAKSVVLRYLNFGLDTDALPHPVHSPIDGSAAASMVKASEALAETLRRVTRNLSTLDQAPDIERVVEAIASDIVDGAIDGEGTKAQMRIAASWHMAAAAVLAESLVNDLHVGGDSATARLDHALRIAFPEATTRTADVIITEAMYEQARVAFLAAERLVPAADLPDLGQLRGQLPERPQASDIAPLIPADLSGRISPAATLALNASDEELADISGIARAAAADDGTYEGYRYDGTYALRLSRTSDRSGSTLLQGQVVEGDAYIFTDPGLEAEQVKFFLNDPFMAGSALTIENIPPHDLGGTAEDDSALPFDTSKLDDGNYTLTALIKLADGSQQLSHASFVLNNIDHWSTKLTLAWHAGDEDVEGYRVFYGSDAEAADTLLFDLPVDTGFADPSAPAVEIDPVYDLGIREGYGSPVCLTVRAYNAEGSSDSPQAVCTSI